MTSVPNFQAMREIVDAGAAHAFGVVQQSGCSVVEIANPTATLAVGTLQAFLDEHMKSGGARELDYVHGDEAVTTLGGKHGNVGIYLPGMKKEDLSEPWCSTARSRARRSRWAKRTRSASTSRGVDSSDSSPSMDRRVQVRGHAIRIREREDTFQHGARACLSWGAPPSRCAHRSEPRGRREARRTRVRPEHGRDRVVGELVAPRRRPRAHSLVLGRRKIAARASVVMLPVGSYPLPFKPIMAPKWRYAVQNAILKGDREAGFTLTHGRGLFDASNCAGVHVHSEVATLPEFLGFNRELADKHNLAVALVPLIALASSPYFRNRHRAHSMRARRYYGRVYRRLHPHGGLPPVFNNSREVLRYYHRGIQRWIARGVELGFAPDQMRRLAERHGAHWGKLRWSRRLNTIELRCLDADRVDLDLAKLSLVAGAMRRLDPNGEALPVEPRDDLPVSRAFSIEKGVVRMPGQERMGKLIDAAVEHGLRDHDVTTYITRLAEFSKRGIAREELFLAEPALDCIARRETTADRILASNGGARTICRERALETLRGLHAEEVSALAALRPKLAAAPR